MSKLAIYIETILYIFTNIHIVVSYPTPWHNFDLGGCNIFDPHVTVLYLSQYMIEEKCKMFILWRDPQVF